MKYYFQYQTNILLIVAQMLSLTEIDCDVNEQQENVEILHRKTIHLVIKSLYYSRYWSLTT